MTEKYWSESGNGGSNNSSTWSESTNSSNAQKYAWNIV